MFRISSISPLDPHILAQVVPTVHETRWLLVAWEICAKSHFLWFVVGMSSSFINVELVSPVIIRKKRKVNLYRHTSVEKQAGYA